MDLSIGCLQVTVVQKKAEQGTHTEDTGDTALRQVGLGHEMLKVDQGFLVIQGEVITLVAGHEDVTPNKEYGDGVILILKPIEDGLFRVVFAHRCRASE